MYVYHYDLQIFMPRQKNRARFKNDNMSDALINAYPYLDPDIKCLPLSYLRSLINAYQYHYLRTLIPCLVPAWLNN